ncbi:MAG: 16S rRNA (guanine(527)-N(7))-methyltransferase RsmG [Chloroflexi bacterium]|nr:16S rRNA (guanine(527)-N(7))-methyltransferase RsmG [Chloroflexota bacterium]
MSTTTHTDSNDSVDSLPLLREWADKLGAPLAEHQLDAFRIYREELLGWTAKRTNLTAITEPDEVESRLFLESLWCAMALPTTEGLRLVDVGTGGGFPGLPLAIAFPQLHITLVEATGKKITFLEHVVGVLGLRNCHVVQGRAEDLGHEPDHREVYDVATARAVAPMPTLVELCLPFVRMNGLLIAPKGADAEQEINDASDALSALGGASEGIVLPDLNTPIPADHRLVVISKTTPSPYRYPRRNGVPAQRPL